MKLAFLLSLLLFQECHTSNRTTLYDYVIRDSNFGEHLPFISDVLTNIFSQKDLKRVHMVIIFRGMTFSHSLLDNYISRYIIKGTLPEPSMQPKGFYIYQGPLSIKEILNRIEWTSKTKFMVVQPKNRSTNRFFIENFSYQYHEYEDSIVTSNEIKQDFEGLLIENKNNSTHLEIWNEAKKISKEFWRQRIQHLVILIPQRTNVYFYTFFPFTKYHCQDDIAPSLINVWFSVSRKFYKPLKMFPKKTGKLYSCPLNVSLIQVPPGVMYVESKFLDGVEGKLVLEILKKLNATAIFNLKQDPQWSGKILAMDLLFQDMMVGHSDIGIGFLIPMTPSGNKMIDDVNFCVTVCLSWAVPNRLVLKSPLIVMLDVFSGRVWLFVLHTLLLALIFYTFLLHSQGWCFGWNKSCEVFFKIIGISLGKSTRVPKQASIQVFLSSFFLFTFSLSTIYQAGFGSDRLVWQPIHQLKTTRDVLSSPLETIGTFAAKQILERKLPLTNPDGGMVDIRPMEVQSGLFKVAYEKRSAFLGFRVTSKYITRISKPELRDLIYLQDECLLQYHPSLVLKPSSPYTEIAAATVQSLVETGFVDHAMKKYMSRINRANLPRPSRMQRPPPSLESANCIFLRWGLYLSFFVFMGEHVVYYIQQKYKGRSTFFHQSLN